MSSKSIVLLVLFVMAMFLWLLSMLGAFAGEGFVKYGGWLPFFAVLFLGVLVVFSEKRP